MDRGTFFVTDRAMLLHKCEWDDNHIESPLRLESILNIIENGEENLLSKCNILESKEASLEDIYLIHSPEYVEKIKCVQNMTIVNNLFKL